MRRGWSFQIVWVEINGWNVEVPLIANSCWMLEAMLMIIVQIILMSNSEKKHLVEVFMVKSGGTTHQHQPGQNTFY